MDCILIHIALGIFITGCTCLVAGCVFAVWAERRRWQRPIPGSIDETGPYKLHCFDDRLVFTTLELLTERWYDKITEQYGEAEGVDAELILDVMSRYSSDIKKAFKEMQR